MDFLKIRRKAKERAARAAARPSGAAGPEAPARPAQPARKAATARPPRELAEPARAEPARPERPEPSRPAAAEPPPTPVRAPRGSPEALALEAEVGWRVAALPHAPDARFVTWRPDGGALPELAAIGPPEAELRPPAPEPVSAGPLDPLDDFFYRDDEAAPAAAMVPAVSAAELLAPSAVEEYLTFQLAGELYAVEIGRVLEVLRTPPITEVPRAPVDVLGVISVRGEVVTVIDPRGRLGLARSEGPPARRVLIADDGEGPCGLLIDGVAGVVRLPRGALEPCPQALGSAGGDAYLGIGRDWDRLFLVLDVGALLRPLRRAVEARPR